MPDTFETIWRRAKAQLASVPPLTVRMWAQEGYSKICDDWGWSFLRAENILTVNSSRTIVGTFTQGSTTVTSAGLFLPTDAGRQLRVTRLPIYTIAAYVDANTVTLDIPYAEQVTNPTTATIQDCYATLPADFRRFLVIYDRYYLRVIPFWMSEDQIAVADPGRVISDLGPRFLIARKYSSAVATLGQVQYEYWPAPTAFRTYPYLYMRRADQLLDSSILPGVLSERAELLELYCMMRGSMWPGTVDQKNPAFSPQMAALYKGMYEEGLNRLELVDDSEYPQQSMTIHWMRRIGAIAPTGTLLRQTDATVNDYY